MFQNRREMYLFQGWLVPIKIQQRMPFFQYWHLYYDSAFIKIPFKLPFALLQQLQIGIETVPWPSLSELPQLPVCLQLLENFLLNQSNWSSCDCNFRELEQTQMELNKILLGLQCQKRYGTQLWKKSKRKIEASIIHFFLFLKKTIAALIPSNCLNIYDASKKKKLSTTLSCLESLINKIISNIPFIYSYLIAQFKEEEKILLTFFEEVNIFIMNLPTANVRQLQEIPKIMEYICVINTLEEERDENKDNFYIRKKNVTLFETPQENQDICAKRERKKNSMNNFTVVNNSIVKNKKSSDNMSNDSPAKEAMNLFKFSDNIRLKSIKRRLKNTISFDSEEKEKSSKNENQLSHSREHLLSVSHSPMKSNTINLPSQNRPKKFTTIHKRKRQETIRTVNSNYSQSFHRIPQPIQIEEIELQRDQKMKKKKIGKLPSKTSCYSEQQILMTGARKGWGIIRQYINEKIARRKLKKLLFI